MGVDQDHGARAAFVAQQMQKEGLLEWLDPEDDYWRLIEALTVHSSGYTTKDLVSARVGTLIVSPWCVLGYRSIRLCCAASIGGLSHLAVRGMLLYAERITEEQEQRRSWERVLESLTRPARIEPADRAQRSSRVGAGPSFVGVLFGLLGLAVAAAVARRCHLALVGPIGIRAGGRLGGSRVRPRAG